MRNVTKYIVYPACIGCFFIQTVSAQQWQFTEEQQREIAARPKPNPAEVKEENAMVAGFNRSTLAYRAAVIQKMLEEANFFSDRLQLPTPHPIRVTDIEKPYPWIPSPWLSILYKQYPPVFGLFPDTIFTTNIYDASIPRETRLHALKIGILGKLGTTNFEFVFNQGRLREVMRLSSEPEVERYAHNLDDLVGKPSLIDANSAYQLATQWLAAVEVNVTALERQFPHAVNQLHYLPSGATNAVLLPLYYVDFGLKPSHRESPVEVEILGTAKELQDITINDPSFSSRPLLLITNALDLVRTPNPPLKQLQSSPMVLTNTMSP
jgi:hypothetical protein